MRTAPLYGAVQDDLSRVEAVFDEIKKVDFGPLSEMLGMVLGGGCKLMRPGLALLCGRFEGVAFEAMIEETLDALAAHLEAHLDLEGLLAAAATVKAGADAAISRPAWPTAD